MASNGKGFMQEGHSCIVAGLAGYRLDDYIIMSLRPNYYSSVRITNADGLVPQPGLYKADVGGCSQTYLFFLVFNCFMSTRSFRREFIALS